ncbi:putative ABC transport system permease protein [Fontibacillus solani]|uniref:Putative hemin transport system permease protein HrtB n=1 Tax=Fontibacillus solani TaxID=1572857 RepID=A0A7W3ST66_9BACL|nr:FtsX-like permease family protein [Fontibacillus solani]MBA9085816.1 putative ABC transport system permease protein [Fontibacillus solani]
MSLFHLLIRNIWHRKALSILTVLSVTATVAFIIILSLSKAGVEQGAEKGYGPFDVVIGAVGSDTQLVLNTFYHVGAPTGNIPDSTLDTVKESSEVDRAYGFTTGDSYNGYPIIGIEPEYFMTRYGDQRLSDGSLYSNTGEVVLGAYTAKMLQLRVGDTFYGAHGLVEGGHLESEEEEEGGEHEEHSDAHSIFKYTITGILPKLHTPDDRAIFTTMDYAWAVHEGADHNKEITAILVKPANLLSAQQLRSELESINGVQVVYSSKAVADVVNLVDKGSEIVDMITILCIVLAAISILLSLVAAASERTKDVGLLRLLGKSRGFVWMAMIGEGLVITSIGLVLGLLLGHVGGYLLQDTLFSYAGIQINPLQWSLDHLIIAAGTIFIGLMASFVPAIRMYRMDSLTLFKA